MHLGRLITDLLDISRIESGQGFTLHTSREDIRAIIQERLAGHQLGTLGHELILEGPAEPCVLFVDRDKLLQVLDNLLNNAIKYSPQGGTIRVGLECRDDHVALRVQDQGIGMTREQVDRIFNKFFRADPSNTAISGVGLGMPIAKHIVEAHGGTITVDSEPGHGTTVTVVLPRGEAEPAPTTMD